MSLMLCYGALLWMDLFADILVITCTYTFHHNCHILSAAVFTLYTHGTVRG